MIFIETLKYYERKGQKIGTFQKKIYTTNFTDYSKFQTKKCIEKNEF